MLRLGGPVSRARVLALAIACFMLAGCLKQSTTDSSEDSALGGLFREITSSVAIPQCPLNCWEATIAAGPTGTIFVATGDDLLAVSKDSGKTFALIPTPPMPEGATGRGDEQVDVGTDGRLYYSGLLSNNGIQIAASSDEGTTWEQDTVIRINPNGGHARYADRQWLAFGQGGTVYLAFQRAVQGVPMVFDGGTIALVVGRSDDGGRSFGPLRELHIGGTIVGQPVVDAAGTLFVPHFYYPPNEVTETAQLRVAVSTDHGETFEFRRVPTGDDSPGAGFPNAAMDERGRLYLSWRNAERTGLFSWSDDQARTWAPPVALTLEGEIRVASSWIVVDGKGTPHITFYVVEEGGASTRLIFATFENGALHKTTVATGITGNADFPSNTHLAHMALTAAGDPVFVWSSSQEKTTWVGLASRPHVEP